MRAEIVEIYSDQSNAAVLRHPGRTFPGMLVQGDTLYTLCCQADEACSSARGSMHTDAYEELNELRNRTINPSLASTKFRYRSQGKLVPNNSRKRTAGVGLRHTRRPQPAAA